MYLELLQLSILLAAAAVFVYIAWQDWRTMEIPDRSHVILIGLAFVQMMGGGTVPLDERGLGLIAISIPMIAMNLLHKDSFGGGDIKMCGATGFFLGVAQMTTGALIGLVLAGMYGAGAVLTGAKKLKDPFPLGPFLSVGFVASMVVGFLNPGY